MNNITKITLIFFVLTMNTFAQQEKGIMGSDNWLNNWTEFKPNQEDYGEPTKILAGNITENTTLFKREVYLLLGNVFVTENDTLTIEPGTVIIGDYKTKASLTIAKGATIIADGSQTDPIIFTSNRSPKRAGDWGGLIILGEGTTNKFGNGSVSAYYTQQDDSTYKNSNFGGDNDADSSGILRYVRIEYSGRRLKDGGYHNGVHLAAVGSGTVIENVMVSHAQGNAFEVWGGDTVMSNMVSYKANCNDFEYNYGAKCHLNNSLAIRSPFVSSSSGSRCLQVLSYNKREQVDFSKPGSEVLATNLTFVNISNNLSNDIRMGLVSEAVYVGHNTSLNMSKTVLSGFNPAVILDNKISINQENLEKIQFSSMYFNLCKGNIFVENNSNNEDLENWYGNSAFFNVYSKGDNSETFIDIKNNRRPDYRLRINKIIASNKK